MKNHRKVRTCPECGQSDCHSLKGWACWNKRITTFGEWYQTQTGVSIEVAERAGVYDLTLLEKAWNFIPPNLTK